jgi:hypothetical protein
VLHKLARRGGERAPSSPATAEELDVGLAVPSGVSSNHTFRSYRQSDYDAVTVDLEPHLETERVAQPIDRGVRVLIYRRAREAAASPSVLVKPWASTRAYQRPPNRIVRW